MADVAQLGLAVDSSQVTSASAALGQLAAASQTAQTATEKLTAATGRSESQVRAIQSAAQRSGVSFQEMAARVDAAGTSHQKFTTASGSAQKALVNLSTQAKTAANDNTNLSRTTDNSTSAFEKLANTLTRRVLFAFAAKEVRDLAAYIFNLNSQLAATADIAGRVGASSAQFQGLGTAAAYKGVTGDQFNASMLAFNQQVDLAKNGVGSLQILLKATGQTVGDTATTFGTVADLVMRAAGNTRLQFSILQQAGLPATREFARLMEQGSAAIQKQVDGASKLSNQQLEDAKKLDDAWQQGWVNFENWGKKAVVNTFSAIGDLAARFKTLAGDTYALPKPGASGDWLGNSAPRGTITRGADLAQPAPLKPPPDPELLKQQNAQAQARLSILGQLLTVDDQVKQKELELAAAGLNLTGVNKQQHDALINLTRAQAELTLINAQAQVGVFNLGKATAQAGHELQGWIDRKLIDPTNATQMAAAQEVLAKRIEQTGQSALVAAAPLEGLQRLANEAGSARTQLDQFATTSFNAVSPALQDMINGTTTLSAGFKNLGLTIVKALEDAIIKITIIKPLIDGLTSGLSSSGILGFLGLGGSNAIAAGGTIPGALGATSVGGAPLIAATGGYITGPGTGTSDSINARLSNGEFVVNARATAQNIDLLHSINGPKGYAAGGAFGNVTRLPGVGQDNATVQMGDTHITIQGSADKETVEIMKQEFAKRDAALHSNVIASVRQAKQQRQL